LEISIFDCNEFAKIHEICVFFLRFCVKKRSKHVGFRNRNLAVAAASALAHAATTELKALSISALTPDVSRETKREQTFGFVKSSELVSTFRCFRVLAPS